MRIRCLTMHGGLVRRSLLIAVVIVGFSACGDSAGPNDRASADTAAMSAAAVVSDPELKGVPGAGAGADAGGAGAVGEVAYVSLPPRTVPLDAVSVEIRNLTASASAAVTVSVVDGGFDPSAVTA